MRACWCGECGALHPARIKNAGAALGGTSAFSFLRFDDQWRRNRLAPYTSADNAVIQKLVGQSV